MPQNPIDYLRRLVRRRPDPAEAAVQHAKDIAEQARVNARRPAPDVNRARPGWVPPVVDGPRPVEAQFLSVPPAPQILVKVPTYVPEEPWGDSTRWQPSDGYVGCGDDVAAEIDDTYCAAGLDRKPAGVPDYTPNGLRHPHVGVDATPVESRWWAPLPAVGTGMVEVRSGWPTPDACVPSTPVQDSSPAGTSPSDTTSSSSSSDCGGSSSSPGGE